MGDYNTGGAGTAPRFQALPRRDPMTPEGGAIMDPNSRPNRDLVQVGRGDPMTPQGGAIMDPYGRRQPGEQEPMGRPTPRPMGGFQPYDDQRDITAPVQGMPRDARQLPNGDVVGRGDPRYFDRGPGIGINPNGRYGPRSYQPGHGNGNGGYGMRGDVRTKGVQNASMGDPMQGDPNSPDAQLRVKRRYERGMSAPAPQENQSYSGTGGGASI